jgi:hypothetical protein
VRGRRLLVLADLVADEFVYGRVQRVSREAPVLILQYDSTDLRPGGGGPTPSTTSARWAASPCPWASWGETTTDGACAR